MEFAVATTRELGQAEKLRVLNRPRLSALLKASSSRKGRRQSERSSKNAPPARYLAMKDERAVARKVLAILNERLGILRA